MKIENFISFRSVVFRSIHRIQIYYYIQCSYSGEMQYANSVAIIAQLGEKIATVDKLLTSGLKYV